jgi:hypothetical protein
VPPDAPEDEDDRCPHVSPMRGGANLGRPPPVKKL